MLSPKIRQFQFETLELDKAPSGNPNPLPRVYRGTANVGNTPLDRLKIASHEIQYKKPHELFNITSKDKYTTQRKLTKFQNSRFNLLSRTQGRRKIQSNNDMKQAVQSQPHSNQMSQIRKPCLGEVIGYENLQAGEAYMFQAAMNGSLDRVGASYEQRASNQNSAFGQDPIRARNQSNVDVPTGLNEMQALNRSLLMARKPNTSNHQSRSPPRSRNAIRSSYMASSEGGQNVQIDELVNPGARSRNRYNYTQDVPGSDHNDTAMMRGNNTFMSPQNFGNQASQQQHGGMESSLISVLNSGIQLNPSQRYTKPRFVTQYDHSINKLVLRTIDSHVKPVIDQSYKFTQEKRLQQFRESEEARFMGRSPPKLVGGLRAEYQCIKSGQEQIN